MRSSEVPAFSEAAFDDSFFAQYEEELADSDVVEQASLALAAILMIEKADGTQKTYEDLRDETETFFTNEWVQQDEALMDRMAVEFAQACMGHEHGEELMEDTALRSVYDRGFMKLASSMSQDELTHAHSTTAPSQAKTEYVTDPKTGKKVKKKKRGWLWFFGIEE